MSVTATTTLPAAYPQNACIGASGRIELAGCDLIELAREYGTPAYLVDEADMRARAQAFMQAAAQAPQPIAVAFASKAFPCSAVLELFAQEGLYCDVASGGELYLALHAGFPADRIIFHGNAKSTQELGEAVQARVGLIVIDNFDEIERLAGLVDSAQQVLIRATPDVAGKTHEKISTGQADSKFGFCLADVPAAIERVRSTAGLQLRGIHAHIGSQLLDLEPFRRAAAALGQFGEQAIWDLGGGLGATYTAEQQRPPQIAEYVAALAQAASEHLGAHELLILEPGRSLTANSCITSYEVESVKHNVSTYVAVNGGMSDNLRPMLYNAGYEADIVDRPGGSTACVLAGKHCESGDILIREALLEQPRAGDIIVTPATGAYTFAMSSNYNGVTRPPVLFCAAGNARVVVRRETYADLTARDVR